MRRITQEELNNKIESHKKYLKNKNGERLVLIGYDLRNSNLSNSDLSNSILSNSNFYNSDLSNSDLSNSNFYNSDLSNSDLSNSNFYNSDLSNSDLSNSDLSHSDFYNSNLSNSDLSNSTLYNSDLKNADLDYSCMPLWCGDLKAHYDDNQIIQQLYHVLSHVKNSKNCSSELKQKLLTQENIEVANKFRRVDECGKI